MDATTIIQTPVILCADDFGISPGVNRAILDLAAKKRLSAVTCMSLGTAWEEGAAALKLSRGGMSVGLHVTLTYLPALTTGKRQPSEKELFLKSISRCLDKKAVEREMRAQFERFISVWGASPDFIDGHQHVHVLPVIRDIFLRLRDEYAPTAWVRNVFDLSGIAENRKNLILAVMGLRFLWLLRQRGIPHNSRLRGPYDYTHLADFSALMDGWCRGKAPVLVYCHPGFPDDALAVVDKVLEPRRREYDFLNGDVFGAWIGTRIKLVGQP